MKKTLKKTKALWLIYLIVFGATTNNVNAQNGPAISNYTNVIASTPQAWAT